MCENNHFNQAYLRHDNENMKMTSMNTSVVVKDSPIHPKTTSSFINSNKNQLSQSPKGNHQSKNIVDEIRKIISK